MAARVGLSGGIGSGKSTVADCFAALGVLVVDADRIARELSEPGTVQFEEIVARFGGRVMDAEGRIDRKRLGEIVFNSSPQREFLEAILHPPIRAEMYARARQDEGCYCILAIPLLVESNQYRQMERVVTVACTINTRMERLQRTRNMQRTEIERVMKNQTSEQNRLAVADDVIDNNDTIAAIEPQVRGLHQTYLKLFG